MSSNELNSSEKILLHCESMFREVSKQEFKILKRMDEKKYMNYLVNRYNELHVNYPALFNLLAQDGDKFNMEQLREMLRLKDRVDRKEVSSQAASEHIGKIYFNKYCSSSINWSKEKQNSKNQ